MFLTYFHTYFHADFLAGHLELRDRVGATICLGAHAEAEYAFQRFQGGDVLATRQRALADARDARAHA